MCSRYREIAVAIVMILACAGCSREERRFSDVVPGATSDAPITLSQIRPGGSNEGEPRKSPYDYNADGIARGKQLYEWFNCSGCHAQGGGAIGPALMDEKWIYGGEAQNIYATIVEGRPNGMPSFRGLIPPQQVWQLVAYVRSMSGQVSKDAAPSRSDHLFMKKSEQSTAVGSPPPVQSTPPQPQ